MSIAVDFAELYTQFRRPIFGFIYRRVNDAALANDLTADVFVKALDAVQRGMAAQEHQTGWLYKIATNLITDYYRKRVRRRHLTLEAIEDTADDRVEDESFDQILLRICFERAASVTTPQQRQVVMMRMEGYEFDEIAQQIGSTYGGVKALQRRAYLALAAALHEVIGRERSLTSETAANVLESLQEYFEREGPMTITELACVSRLQRATVQYALYNNPQLFVRVRERGKAFVWGLRP